MFLAKKNPVSAFVVFVAFALAFCLMGWVLVEPAHADTEGWKLVKNGKKLVYVQKDGTKAKSRTIDGIKLKSDGYAKSNTASKLKIACLKRVAKLTNSKMTKRQKLYRCWKWVQDTIEYSNHVEPRDVNTRGWVSRAALKTIKNHNYRECYTAAAAFAMLAYELGYKPTMVEMPGYYAAHHCLVKIGSKYYDNRIGPGFGEGKIHIRIQRTWRIVSWADTDPLCKERPKRIWDKGSYGLELVDGDLYYLRDGYAVTSKWKTVKGHTYYFGRTGKAATGAKKIKGTYYVFSSKGKLLKGNKTRLVKVRGETYRVTKAGKAKSGWVRNKQGQKVRYYEKTGCRLHGICLVGGKITAFASNGAYKDELTKKLRAAARSGEDATLLLQLLGTPDRTKTGLPSCYSNEMNGTDSKLYYGSICVNVFHTDTKDVLESVAPA